MRASFILHGTGDRGISLEVETRPHPTLGGHQITSLTVGRLTHGSWNLEYTEVKNLDVTDRKALAAFLLSIPDDQP